MRTVITFSAYRPGSLLRVAGLACLYALIAKVVLTFFSDNGVVTIIWPPSGLALAAILIGGTKYWPGVYAGALLANLWGGSPLWVSVIIAIGNTLEPLFAGWLLTRGEHFDSSFRRFSDYSRFLLRAAVISPLISVTLGTVTLLLSGFLTPPLFIQNYLHWWMGDALGIVLLAPLILVWREFPGNWKQHDRFKESIVLYMLAFLAGQVIFLGWFHESFGTVARGYWMFLFVAWAVVRLGTQSATLITFMAAVQALIGAAEGVGFFGTDIADTQLFNFWFYIFTLAVVGMAQATAIQERKIAEDKLQASTEHLNEAQRIAHVGHWALDQSDGKLSWSEELLNLFEIDPNKPGVTYEAFLNAIHPEDREAANRAHTELFVNHMPYEIEYRLLMHDKRIKWVCERGSSYFDAPGKPLRSVGTVQDVTEHRRTQRQMRDLTSHLHIVREEEKARIAREIHDDLGSTLTALKMDINWLADELSVYQGATPLQKHVESMSQLLDQTVAVTRRVITDLRPSILDDLGLQAALEWQAGQFQKRTGIQCSVTCVCPFSDTCIEGAGCKDELGKLLTISLFRIFQESLTNVVRHSGASKVEVELRREGEDVILAISDNGCGLPEEHTISQTSYGMLGMRERAEQLGGRVDFHSQSGNGFNVMVMLPLLAGNRIEEKIWHAS